MKPAKPTTSATEALIQYIMNLTQEQTEKVMKRLPQVEKLLNMSDNEIVFTEALTDRIFGNRPGSALQ